MSKVYTYVQERIIKALEEAIENGTPAPWVKPWNKGERPQNFVTKVKYRGINSILLPFGGYYVTRKQLNDLKKKHPFLSLKKDVQPYMVVYWKFPDVKSAKEDNIEEEDNDKKSAPIFKYYKVYHQSDIEGFEKLVEDVVVDYSTDIEIALERYNEEVEICHYSGDDACYVPTTDKIMMPLRSLFKSSELYYACVCHEIIHSSGHKSRLDRFEKGEFGSEVYSKEELVAEIGSSMLLCHFGIENTEIENNNVAYLKSWLSVLQNDIKLITYAAQRAQKAVDYVLDIMESESISNQNQKLTA